MFTPIRIGTREIANRFVMLPMYLNAEQDTKRESPEHFRTMAKFYEERARHGAEWIVVGGIAPSTMGRWRSGSLSLTSSTTADGLRVIPQAVHKASHGRAVCTLQAYHAGRSAFRRFRLSPSSTPNAIHPFKEYSPIRVPSMLMDVIVGEYERFAMLAEAAGFHGIELAFSEGGLVHNFLSTSTNDRLDDDVFGGATADQRMELALRILANVKNSVKDPKNFTVGVRMCLHDLKPDGTSMDDIKFTAEVLCGSGAVDLLTSSVGMQDSPVQTLAATVPQATFTRCTQVVRTHLRSKGILTPIVASHRIHTPEVAEKLLNDDVCDLVGLARPLLADAQFIRKLETGRSDTIVPCIGCNHCVNRLYKHQRVGCAVNPVSNFEFDAWRNAPPAKFIKNVAVVGAGAAGIMCALTLSMRGHQVILYERGPELGGQLNLAKVVPGKEDYFRLLKYWTERLRESTVKVKLNTNFDEREMTSGHQALNAVVLCTGGSMKPVKSNYVPGASECKMIVPFTKILDGSVTAGRRVVIFGNGAIAFDVASYLMHSQQVSRSVSTYCSEWGVNLETGTLDILAQADCTKNNRDVVLLNKPEKDADLSKGKGWSQKLWLKNHRATVIPNALIEQVHPDGVSISVIMPDNRKLFIPADTIVWANGMLPNMTVGTWIYEWLKDGAQSRGQVTDDFGIYMAGTCRDAYTGDGHGEQDMMQVIHEGFELGCKI